MIALQSPGTIFAIVALRLRWHLPEIHGWLGVSRQLQFDDLEGYLAAHGLALLGQVHRSHAPSPKACRDGFTALFLKAAELFRDLATARADRSHGRLLDRLSRADPL